MLTWILENAATILISAVILLAVVIIVRGMAKGKIKTCSDCGGDCSACHGACPMKGEEARHDSNRS